MSRSAPMTIRVVYGRIDPTNLDHLSKGGHGYAYRTVDPVDVGDIVRVPGNWLHPGAQEATVVGHGSTYDGEIALTLGVVERKATR